jgi:hypothetical protein
VVPAACFASGDGDPIGERASAFEAAGDRAVEPVRVRAIRPREGRVHRSRPRAPRLLVRGGSARAGWGTALTVLLEAAIVVAEGRESAGGDRHPRGRPLPMLERDQNAHRRRRSHASAVIPALGVWAPGLQACRRGRGTLASGARFGFGTWSPSRRGAVSGKRRIGAAYPRRHSKRRSSYAGDVRRG